MPEIDARRINMVNSQILPNKVLDGRVTDAIKAVPREEFVPKTLRSVAYLDEDIPLGGGRYLLEPMIFARMVDAAAIGEGDLVLDVACATGYSTAVLARLAASVVGLESDEELAAKTDARLTELGIDNAAVVAGPLEAGFASQAPYDVIFVNGAVEVVPSAWTEQLADGGRLVAVVRSGAIGRATLFTREGDGVAQRELFDAQLPLLPGLTRPQAFTF